MQTGTAAATTAAKSDPEPQPCPGCRNLGARLTAADERIAALKAAHPDVVMAAELEAVTEQRNALQAEVASLRAQLSAALSGAGEADPYDDLTVDSDGADSAHGNGQAASQAGPCVHCGRPGPLFLYDGVETGKFACDRCYAKARDPLVSRRAA